MRFGIKLLTFGISAIVGATVDYFISNRVANYCAPTPAAIPTTTPESTDSTIVVETID